VTVADATFGVGEGVGVGAAGGSKLDVPGGKQVGGKQL